MRSFNITALIGAAALAIRGVSGVALPVPDVNVAKPDALAEPNTFRIFLQSRATPNCVWQYNDISGGTCPQQIRDLNIGTLPRLLEECYHYTCTCKRDVNQIEASAQASADLAKREPIDASSKPESAFTAPDLSKRENSDNIQPSSSGKWAMPASIHGGSLYPSCGAPICKLRRALFGERAAEEERTHPTAKQLGGPALCGFICEARRALVG
ncbi:MAG: hypothetical protein L6R37_005378 [Teloschistes peruensis]|nr:MAG: hypothetical protein L6R37_005378 [Teloschistes peruensis]